MDKSKPFSVAEKLKYIRKAKGIMQSSFGNALNWSASRISEIEGDRKEYTGDQIIILKALLDIEDAPITDKEIEKFKSRMNFWKDCIQDRNMYEAEKIRIELSGIKKLPFEKDLNITYNMIEINQRLRQDNFADNVNEIREHLEEVENYIESSTSENRHYFYCNRAFVYQYDGKAELAMRYYEEAVSIKDDSFKQEASVYYNLALAYSRLGMAVRAIIYLKDCSYLIDYEKNLLFGLAADNTLAVNYIRAYQTNLALPLLDKALERANGINDKKYIGIILHNYGATYIELGDYEKAVEYFDSAFKYIDEGSEAYLENLYAKIYALILKKDRAEYKRLFLKLNKLENVNEHYKILFHGLTCITNIKEPDALKFVQNTVIPHLINNHLYNRVLDFIDVAIDENIRKNSNRVARELDREGRKILKMILGGGEIA